MARPLPPPDVPVVEPTTGLISQTWFDYLKDRDQLKVGGLRDVSATAPTNGQVLIYNSTSKLWVPGAN